MSTSDHLSPHETARPSGGSRWARGRSFSGDTSDTILIDEEQGHMPTSNATPAGGPPAAAGGHRSKGWSLWKDEEDDEEDSEPPTTPILTGRHAKAFPPASDGGGGGLSSGPMSFMSYGEEEYGRPASEYSRPTSRYEPQATPPRPVFLTGKHAKELPTSAAPSMFVDDEVDIDQPPDDSDDDDDGDANDGDADASAMSLTYPGGRPFNEPDQGSGHHVPPPVLAANPARQSMSANASVHSRSNERRRSDGTPVTPDRKSQTQRPEGFNHHPAVLQNPQLAKLGRGGGDNNNSGSGSGSASSQFHSRGSVTSAGLVGGRRASNDYKNHDDGSGAGAHYHVADTRIDFSAAPHTQQRRISTSGPPENRLSSTRRNSVHGSGVSLDSFKSAGGVSPSKTKRPRHPAGGGGGSSRNSVGSLAGAGGEKRHFGAGAISSLSSRGSSLNSFTGYINLLLSKEAAHGPPPSFRKDGFRKWFGPWLSRTVLSIKGMILLLFLVSILSCTLFLGYYQAASDLKTVEMLVDYLQLSSGLGVRNSILNRVQIIEDLTRMNAAYYKSGLWTIASITQPGASFWSCILYNNIPDLYLTQNALATPYTGSLYGAEVYAPNVMMRWSAQNATHTLQDYYDFDGNPLSNPPQSSYPNYVDQAWVTQLFPLTRDKAESGYWTGIIVYDGVIYVSFSVPIYAADNATIQYTMGADFTLDFLSTVTEEYKASDPLSPDIVILGADGSIVASTFPDTTITTTPPGGGDPVLVLAADSPTPAIRAANTLMLAATPDHTYNTLTDPIVQQVQTEDSGPMFVTALACTTDTGIRLIVMQFQRRATIFDVIDRASNTTAGIVAAFVAGMVVLTMLLLHWVTKPLLVIQQAMNDLFVDHADEDASAVSMETAVTGSGKKNNNAAGAEPAARVQATAHMEDDPELGVSRSPTSKLSPASNPGTMNAPKDKDKRLSNFKRLSRLSEISDLQISFLKMKETIRAFERFVPPVVVQRIIGRESKAKELYVEKKEVAMLFSDIQDFTTIAERMPSEVLISMLAQYFDEMTRAIERSHGVLCDFIGDGLMIFWNAPKSLDDFPTRALDCALDMQVRVGKLNASFHTQGWPELIVRMAIHVGTVHAGNVGSRHRMKLGVVGDNVNLASRLEGLNKRYSSRVIISEDCRRALRKPEHYLMRPLESVIVKGRSQSVDVYEVFGPLAVQPPRTVEMVEAYGVVHQMVGAINPQRSAKKDRETVAAACDAYNAKYPKDQMGQLLREKVVRGTFGQPLAMNEK
ncbi:hypothetical protein HDU87_005235 [Geranomyces variabilis]|uniref:Guanylate cyclase domain-containing protein n=1 Tax=Geranomyces variabilis TaxID=109894 RepID=A0AAD5XLF1_9FUNG|nr:hypothetical protein HDU87_005235 [Geranomyces variabilis]